MYSWCNVYWKAHCIKTHNSSQSSLTVQNTFSKKALSGFLWKWLTKSTQTHGDMAMCCLLVLSSRWVSRCLQGHLRKREEQTVARYWGSPQNWGCKILHLCKRAAEGEIFTPRPILEIWLTPSKLWNFHLQPSMSCNCFFLFCYVF